MDPLQSEFSKGKVFIVGEIIEYAPDSVISTTILRKPTGSIKVVSFDSGEKQEEETLPFDKFIQVIDGRAEIFIDYQSHLLETGQSIIIPAHSKNSFKAHKRFKMISTVIKSGYENLS